jgi:hypothetical protein
MSHSLPLLVGWKDPVEPTDLQWIGQQMFASKGVLGH